MTTAGKKISQLTEATTANAADILPIVQDSETKFVSKETFLNDYYSREEVDGLNTAFEQVSQKGQPDGYVPLGSGGKIASQYIPAIGLTEVYVVADEAERDALEVQEGDFAVVTGTGATYVYSGTEWIVAATSPAVSSVNGQIGTVVLDTGHVSEGSNLYYTDARVATYLSSNGFLHAGDPVSALTNDAGYLTSYTETDPVFLASPAAGITAPSIASWTAAYGWGNHASAGYVVGPGSSVDNAIARFDLTTGKVIQASSVYINDSGYLGVGISNATTNVQIVAPYAVSYTPTALAGGLRIDNNQTTVDDAETSIQFVTSRTSGSAGAGKISLVATAAGSGAFTFVTRHSGVYAERVRITSDGYVGVNIADPSVPMHVRLSGSRSPTYNVGTGLAVQSTGTAAQNSRLAITSGSTSIAGIDFGDATDVDAGRIYYENATNSFEFYTDGSVRLLIDNAGDISVGNTTTDGKLSVRQTGTGDIFNLYDGATNVLTVLDGGRVGIGTGTPLSRFHVQDTLISNKHFINESTIVFEGTEGAMQFIAADTGAYAGSIILTAAPDSGNNKHWGIIAGGPNVSNRFSLQYKESATTGFALGGFSSGEVFTVTTAGNVGIGSISPTAKLDISSDILRLRTAKTPSTAGAVGNQGDLCWDASYVYVCVSANSWKRAALSTW